MVVLAVASDLISSSREIFDKLAFGALCASVAEVKVEA